MIRLTSIVLAMLVLLSSSGLTYAAHYCGSFRMMETLTYGKAALSCGMVMATSACEDEHNDDHGCCDNEYTDVLKDDHFAKSQFDLQLKVDLDLLPLESPDYYLDGLPIARAVDQPPYRPPPPRVKRYLILETFLI